MAAFVFRILLVYVIMFQMNGIYEVSEYMVRNTFQISKVTEISLHALFF